MSSNQIPQPGSAQPQSAQLQSAQSLLRRRRRLLWGSSPVVLISVVVAVKLLSLPLSAGLAGTAYDGGDADGTVRAAQAMGTLNVVERYKAHFALGDGHVLRGDFEQARQEFSRALDLVPANESCKVRVNLVLSLEKLGDAQEKAGDPASAKELFSQGSEVVAQAPRDCFAPNSENNKDGEGDALKQAQERLAEKQSGKQDGDQEPAPDAEGTEPADEPADGKQEELEKSGRNAQKERSQSQKFSEDYAEDEPEQYAKPW
ncbi:tetratricopeptide repeat protein [Specibacter sp. AOP5-B1-6]|uniref:tetratricopeptide repeat protein n=1 Tax=Specibacter sp. AOP5-B1-6 TaxID=3457653 RepID=UPI00402B1744